MAQCGAQHISRHFSRVSRVKLRHECRDFLPVFRRVQDGSYVLVGWRDGDSVLEGNCGVGELFVIPAGGVRGRVAEARHGGKRRIGGKAGIGRERAGSG